MVAFDDALSAIRARTSVRGYADTPLDDEQLNGLEGWIQAADHLTPAGPRIELVRERERVDRILTSIVGSYGLIRNAPHLLAGILPEESDLARLDLGYVLEQIVVKAAEAGLGTCWITGSYSPERATGVLRLASVEVAAAVCALGLPAGGGWNRFHCLAIHVIARGHRRRPLQALAFAERWGAPWSPEGVDARLVQVLAHARVAPSAINRQPWRFVVGAGGLVLATVRPAPIDAGIVMAHVTLAASALGWPGAWEVRYGDPGLAAAVGLPRSAVPVAVFR